MFSTFVIFKGWLDHSSVQRLLLCNFRQNFNSVHMFPLCKETTDFKQSLSYELPGPAVLTVASRSVVTAATESPQFCGRALGWDHGCYPFSFISLFFQAWFYTFLANCKLSTIFSLNFLHSTQLGLVSVVHN